MRTGPHPLSQGPAPLPGFGSCSGLLSNAPSTITYPRPCNSGGGAGPFRKVQVPPRDHPDLPFSSAPGGPSPRLPGPQPLSPLAAPSQHLTQHNGSEAGRGARGDQAGEPSVAGNPVPRRHRHRSCRLLVLGRQVQPGPRWPDSCRSRPPLPPRAARLAPRARRRRGRGAAPPPYRPFPARGPGLRRLQPSRVGSTLWLAHTSFRKLSGQPWFPFVLLPSPRRSVGTATMAPTNVALPLSSSIATAPFLGITFDLLHNLATKPSPTSFTLPSNPLLFSEGSTYIIILV